MGTVVGLICGGGILMGLYFAGISIWPPPRLEGTCQITNLAGVTYQCVGGRGKSFKMNMANITFEDGSTRTCNTFWLTDKCGLLFSDRPTEVIEGEARPCLWFESEVDSIWASTSWPAGACVEPGHVTSFVVNSIVWWVIGAVLFCCCFCCCLYIDATGGKEDASAHRVEVGKEDTGAHKAKGDNDHARTDLQGKAATATHADVV